MDDPAADPADSVTPSGRTIGAGRRQATAQLVAVGLAAGFLSGLLGVGGGVLMVPGLVLVLGMGQRLAHGTSLAAIVPIAVAGLAGYALAGEVDWLAALFLAVGAAGVGAPVGTYLLHVLPTRVLAVVFAILLVATAARLLAGEGDAAGRGDLTVAAALGLVAVGVLAGTLSGLLGVGGGVVMIPALVVLLGVPAAMAKGSSLAVILPTALVGTWRNVTHHNADLHVAAVVGLTGTGAAFLASQLSVGLDERLSNRLFAGLLLAVAAKLLWDNRRPHLASEGGAAAEPGDGGQSVAM
jgi:uncharacterized membrane protein YfcA